jgi:Fe-Mn family superoxide dismutase
MLECGDANVCNSLQYQNRKAEYFKAIWDVINWKAAERRFK